jgi:hypothetical protein
MPSGATVNRTLSRLCVVVALLVAGGCSNGDTLPAERGNGGRLVTQFFAIFNDGTADNFHACLNLNPPYELWDITFIAFLHTYERDGLYVADYENARGLDRQGLPIPPAAGDTDSDRIRQLMQAAKATNSDMKFIISLGWSFDDIANGAENPPQFAASVGDIIEANDLDGFDVDFESAAIEVNAFRAVSQALRAELDARGRAMQKRLYLTITPAQTDGLDFAAVDELYDYVQMQSYDASADKEFPPTSIVGQGIASAKILFGRDIEGGDTLAAPLYDIPDVAEYVSENALAGLMGWRVNAGNQMTVTNPFSGVRLLGEAFDAD